MLRGGHSGPWLPTESVYLCVPQRLTLETDPQWEQTKKLPNLHRPYGLSPQREPDGDFIVRNLDLPSRRREYLQQLRKDVVETTR